MLAAFTLNSAAFVVVMHFPRGQRSRLAEVLDRYTVLDVEPAQDGILLQASHVYIVPESENVAVRGGRLTFEGSGRTTQGTRNIDHFFESLALSYGSRAVGVVLSGAGYDGTAGLAAIHRGGGTTFVQSSETALFAHMPGSASPSADFQLAPHTLGQRLMLLLAQLEVAWLGAPMGGPA